MAGNCASDMGGSFPPVEAYVDERPTPANGHGNTEQSAPAPAIELRTALQIAQQPQRATWLLRRIIERAALILVFGSEGTLKSFVVLHWALHIAALDQPVVYLHGEGRGLWKRLRAWCQMHRPGRRWQDVLGSMPFFAVERPVNLSSSGVTAALVQAIDTLGIKPVLIVADTAQRNSDGLLERSNEDAAAYLNQLDVQIRSRYASAVVLVHHVGHGNKERARGPFTLTASTDANFRFERPDPSRLSVTVTSGRMKDCEPPPPFAMEAEVITIEGEFEEDGSPVTSLAVRESTSPPPAAAKPLPKGRNQQLLLGALREHVRQSGSPIIATTDLLDIAKSLKLSRKRLPEIRGSLERDGWIVQSIGGFTLTGDDA